MRSYRKWNSGEDLLIETFDTDYVTLLFIWSTHCNFACPHCLAQDGGYGLERKNFSMEVYQKALKYQEANLILCAEKGLYEHLDVGNYFFGGEPLLNSANLVLALDQQATLADRLASRFPQISFATSTSVSTNGTLLSPNLAKVFADYDVEVILSIDGPEHDTYRPLRDGGGSLNRVLRG